MKANFMMLYARAQTSGCQMNRDELRKRRVADLKLLRREGRENQRKELAREGSATAGKDMGGDKQREWILP